jgi:hypothetical protein
MTLPAYTALVLAQLDQSGWAEAFRRGFQEEVSDTHSYTVLIAIAAMCGVLLAVRLLRPPNNGATASIDYLAEAARRVGLGRTELQDLQNVARRASLSHPAAMLLSPANLTHAVQSALGQADDPPLRRRLDRLSRSLYGVPLPDASTLQSPPPPTGV